MERFLTHVRTSSQGIVSRRDFVRTLSSAAAASATAGLLGWKAALTVHAEQLRRQGQACILLFFNGGPSQFETFDPKPGHENGGPTKAIKTTVTGIQLAEHWAELAKQMKQIALIRSMTNKEGAHARAVYQMHTGYLPAGAIKYPSLGSIISKEIAPPDFELPHYVNIGGRFNNAAGAGFLGSRYAPFVVSDPNRMPSNSQLTVSPSRFQRRLALTHDLESDFARAAKELVHEHQNVQKAAAKLVLTPKLRAFDLSQEKDAVRDRYGRTPFGQGCLLARRLIEAGVTFVEVELSGWDTHQDNFERTKALSLQADKGFAALVADLKERGMLERTLVLCIGEFGRTPRINGQNGRDHFPRAFSAALAGGGVRGGQVVGATNESGTDINDRPVTIPDLFCTICHVFGINPRKENVGPLDRPIKLVDGGSLVKELF